MKERIKMNAKETGTKKICLVCQSPLNFGEELIICPSCRRAYHLECWQENKGCAVYGCPEVPLTEPLNELEIPAAHWGKEKKFCPSCGKEILAAALRCTHCGAIFPDARPMSGDEYEKRKNREENVKQLKTRIILIIFFSLISFTAPFAVIFGYKWYRSRKEELQALPFMYSRLLQVALSVGAVQVALLVLFAILYTIFA